MYCGPIEKSILATSNRENRFLTSESESDFIFFIHFIIENRLFLAVNLDEGHYFFNLP
jgi:hypothetical protein